CPPPSANHRSFCVTGSQALKIPPRTLLPSGFLRSGPCGGGDAIGVPPRAPARFSPKFCAPGGGVYLFAATKVNVFSTAIGTYTKPVFGLKDICDVLCICTG